MPVLKVKKDGIWEEVKSLNTISTGGANLNFSVNAYHSADAFPSVTSENAIGVITNVDIATYVFCQEEPAQAQNGVVWFKTGVSSAVEFDAISENTIMVYPLSAKQYIDGAWVHLPAKIYKSGEWVDWWTGVLFDNGDQCVEHTGGWSNSTNTTSLSQGVYSSLNYSTPVSTNNKIDLTAWNTLNITLSSVTTQMQFGISNVANVTSGSQFILSSVQNKYGTYSIDLSSVSGEYYIALIAGTSTGGTYCEFVASKVWLE